MLNLKEKKNTQASLTLLFKGYTNFKKVLWIARLSLSGSSFEPSGHWRLQQDVLFPTLSILISFVQLPCTYF